MICLIFKRCETISFQVIQPINSLVAIMSWRNQGITGSNNIPLGNRRRFGGDDNGDSRNGSSYDSPSHGNGNGYGHGNESGKRGRSPVRGESQIFLNTLI